LKPVDHNDLAPLARHDDEPAFDEQWQAQVLALAANLTESGVFSASAWSDALGAELERAYASGQPDNHETYYAAALAALEHLLAEDGRVDGRALDDRAEQWRRAYLNTPHGEPVELSAG
jgi:nitrile hydratase accessory protein